MQERGGAIFNPLYFAYLVAADRDARRFFTRWIRSFRQRSISDGVPWLPFALIEWFERHLRPDMTIFEYGSGGSTLFIAPRVKQLVSVEHDRSWHQSVADALERRGIRNVIYSLHEPTKPASLRYPDHFGGYEGHDFERYVTAIDAYPDGAFDVVLVDGRARKFCLEQAIPKIKPGGYLWLDNANTCLDFLSPLERYPRLDVNGISPFWPPSQWLACGWRIDAR
jgi:hypothetical protein